MKFGDRITADLNDVHLVGTFVDAGENGKYPPNIAIKIDGTQETVWLLQPEWKIKELTPTPRELPLKTVISAGTFEYIKVAVNTWVEFGASRYDDLFSAYRDEDFGTEIEVVE